MRAMGDLRVSLRTQNCSKLIVILTNLRQVKSTHQPISRRARNLILKAPLRRTRINRKRNSIRTRLLPTSNGLSTVRSTFAVIPRQENLATFKTLPLYLSKEMRMVTSWQVLKMSLRRILNHLISSWATPTPHNSSLKLKIKWTFKQTFRILSSKRLSSNKRLPRSNSDVVRLKFRALRGKFNYKRTNNKVLVKLIECNIIHSHIDKVLTQWHKSHECNREDSNKAGLWDLKKLERTTSGRPSHNVLFKT